MRSDALVEAFAILTTGGRNNEEMSRALPQRAYSDPANHVEFPAERARREKIKQERKAKKLKYRKGK